jgi:DNA-binding GntR family transcriptional regulator
MMQARISLLRRMSLGRPARLDASIGEIRAIVRAIKARDPDATWKACMEHVERAAEAALAPAGGEKKKTAAQRSKR